MAKAALNSALTSLRGSIDNWVYRKTGDGLVVTRRPQITAPPSPAQLAVRELFRAAAAYAKTAMADPVQGPRYAAAAAQMGLRPFALAVSDFLKPPVVQAIDPVGYHGAVGDAIKVRAFDEFEVTGVTVELRDAADVVLEQGPAVLAEGTWRYLATTPVAAGTALTIRAVATDRPGNTGSLQLPLVVA